jgi:hypothetical protein
LDDNRAGEGDRPPVRRKCRVDRQRDRFGIRFAAEDRQLAGVPVVVEIGEGARRRVHQPEIAVAERDEALLGKGEVGTVRRPADILDPQPRVELGEIGARLFGYRRYVIDAELPPLITADRFRGGEEPPVRRHRDETRIEYLDRPLFRHG